MDRNYIASELLTAAKEMTAAGIDYDFLADQLSNSMDEMSEREFIGMSSSFGLGRSQAKMVFNEYWDTPVMKRSRMNRVSDWKAWVDGILSSKSASTTAATKTAISVVKAAYLLFDEGKKSKEVESIINKMKQPTSGYVYMEDVSKHLRK